MGKTFWYGGKQATYRNFEKKNVKQILYNNRFNTRRNPQMYVHECIDLWKAVLRQAILDSMYRKLGEWARVAGQQKIWINCFEAGQWIESNNRDIYSFLWICDISDYDPESIRKYVRTLTKEWCIKNRSEVENLLYRDPDRKIILYEDRIVGQYVIGAEVREIGKRYEGSDTDDRSYTCDIEGASAHVEG